jgi:hypothetical protein
MARKAESKARPRRRRNPEPVTRHAAAVRNRIPADQTNLTRQERALLPDPDRVTEDDADAIIGLRREREPGRRYSLEEVLRENGYKLER